MNNVSLGKKRLVRVRSALAALVACLLFSPLSALATTSLPAQVLPPGTGKSCAPVSFSDIAAHVYSGSLDSFDITVSDPHYVAVLTSVSGSPIEYHYITRWANPDGSVRMHVDLPSTSTYADLPIQIVFLATPTDSNGLPLTCVFNVEVVIKGTHVPTYIGQGSIETPRTPETQPSAGSGTGAAPIQTSTSTTSTLPNNVGLVAASHALGRLCLDGGATKLWVILLVLYALFVFILSAQKNDAGATTREWNIVLILAIFLALLVFWYVSSSCRVSPWAPACATLIAVIGLIYTMFQQQEPEGILLLKDGKK